MTGRLRSERGWALVSAVMVMMIMMSIGLATVAIVDNQARQSNHERGQESSFNYAEGVLNAQTFAVANAWPTSGPGLGDCTYNGSTVTSTNGSLAGCPNATVVSQSFRNKDHLLGSTWITMVRDNGGTEQCEDTPNANCSYIYDDAATLANQPHWDANADNLLWLRAEGTVHKDRRIVVALVRIQDDPISFPQAVIVAGSAAVQGGNKPFIFMNGGTISLRCQPVTSSSCLSTQKPVEIQGPGNTVGGYDDGGHVLSDDELDGLKARATHYYPAGQCPDPHDSAQWSGAIVYIEGADCDINGNITVNPPPQAPGIIIFNDGHLTVNGNATINGLVYFHNASGYTDSAFKKGNGNATINGAVFVDGNASLDNQGSIEIHYDATPLQNVASFGATGIVPNSFREIHP